VRFSPGAVDPAEIDRWEWALAESANNALTTFVPDRRQLPIRADLIVTPRVGLKLRVTDHTAGFDFPERVERPPDESESGRGLFIIKSLTDEARYLRGRGENCLVLRKTPRRVGAGATACAGGESGRGTAGDTRTARFDDRGAFLVLRESDRHFPI